MDIRESNIPELDDYGVGVEWTSASKRKEKKDEVHRRVLTSYSPGPVCDASAGSRS